MSSSSSGLPKNRELRIAIFDSGKKQREIAIDAHIPETRLSDIVHRCSPPTPDEQERIVPSAEARGDCSCVMRDGRRSRNGGGVTLGGWNRNSHGTLQSQCRRQLCRRGACAHQRGDLADAHAIAVFGMPADAIGFALDYCSARIGHPEKAVSCRKKRTRRWPIRNGHRRLPGIYEPG